MSNTAFNVSYNRSTLSLSISYVINVIFGSTSRRTSYIVRNPWQQTGLNNAITTHCSCTGVFSFIEILSEQRSLSPRNMTAATPLNIVRQF